MGSDSWTEQKRKKLEGVEESLQIIRNQKQTIWRERTMANTDIYQSLAIKITIYQLEYMSKIDSY